MNYIVPATLSAFVLAGCGGGGVNDGNTYTSVAPSVNEYANEIRAHTSGKSIFSGKEVEDTETRSFIAAVTSEDALNKLYISDETSPISIVSTSYYGQNSTGTFTDVTFNIGTERASAYFYLDEQNNEEVDIRLVFTDGTNILATGDELTSLPKGRFTYEGGNMIERRGYVQTGSFSMDVDFDNSNASLSANTSNYNIGANNIIIDTKDGTFSSDALEIANPYTMFQNYWTGQLDGTFTGSGATGVVATYTSDDGSILGGLAGVRQ